LDLKETVDSPQRTLKLLELFLELPGDKK